VQAVFNYRTGLLAEADAAVRTQEAAAEALARVQRRLPASSPDVARAIQVHDHVRGHGDSPVRSNLFLALCLCAYWRRRERQAKEVARQLRRRLADADATIGDEWTLAHTQRQQLNAAAVAALAHSHARRERAILTALQAAQAHGPRTPLAAAPAPSNGSVAEIATLPITALGDGREDEDDHAR
jgi:hypothetical protein